MMPLNNYIIQRDASIFSEDLNKVIANEMVCHSRGQMASL